VGAFGLLVAALIYNYVRRQPAGSDLMIGISRSIQNDMMAFLKVDYRALSAFAVVLFPLLLAFAGCKISAIAFLYGVILSAAIGLFGLKSAAGSSLRTAHAASEFGQIRAFGIAFSGAAAVGLAASSLGVLGMGSLLWGSGNRGCAGGVPVIGGFAMGVSLTSLVTSLGGAIYAKVAGLAEADIAGLAAASNRAWDGLRDIVGTGMGIFESYVGSIAASVVIGTVGARGMEALYRAKLISLPVIIAAIGLIASLLGFISARLLRRMSPASALRFGTSVSVASFLAGGFLAVRALDAPSGIFWALSSGCAAGIAVGLLGGYYALGRPVRRVAGSARFGPAVNVISGLSVGMGGVALQAAIICLATWSAYKFAGIYGIGISAVGAVATAGMAISLNVYGPIAADSVRIAGMSGLGPKVGEITDGLDVLGSSASSLGRGFTVGAASMTAVAFLSAYKEVSGIGTADLAGPGILIGAFIGGVIPLLVASMILASVARAIPGAAAGDDPSAAATLRGIAVPGAAAFICPIAVGLWLGPGALGGFLAGATLTCVLMALAMVNGGNVWCSARRYIERGYLGREGSEPHRAAVIGGEIGSLFRGGLGPSISALMKLMAVVSLLLVPLLMR